MKSKIKPESIGGGSSTKSPSMQRALEIGSILGDVLVQNTLASKSFDLRNPLAPVKE